MWGRGGQDNIVERCGREKKGRKEEERGGKRMIDRGKRGEGGWREERGEREDGERRE